MNKNFDRITSMLDINHINFQRSKILIFATECYILTQKSIKIHARSHEALPHHAVVHLHNLEQLSSRFEYSKIIFIKIRNCIIACYFVKFVCFIYHKLSV